MWGNQSFNTAGYLDLLVFTCKAIALSRPFRLLLSLAISSCNVVGLTTHFCVHNNVEEGKVSKYKSQLFHLLV